MDQKPLRNKVAQAIEETKDTKPVKQAQTLQSKVIDDVYDARVLSDPNYVQKSLQT